MIKQAKLKGRLRRGNQYKILTYTQKKEIIENFSHIQGSELEIRNQLSDIYGISAKNIRRWQKYGIERKKGCGRKKLNTNAERELETWCIQQSQIQGRRVSRSQIRQKAIELFSVPEFKASKAWQDEFIRQRDLKYKISKALFDKNVLSSHQQRVFLKQMHDRGEDSSILKIDSVQSQVKVEEESLPVKVEEEQQPQVSQVRIEEEQTQIKKLKHTKEKKIKHFKDQEQKAPKQKKEDQTQQKKQANPQEKVDESEVKVKKGRINEQNENEEIEVKLEETYDAELVKIVTQLMIKNFSYLIYKLV